MSEWHSKYQFCDLCGQSKEPNELKTIKVTLPTNVETKLQMCQRCRGDFRVTGER
jgi:NADH pyrophosphatase NudC (nudix superfamily)